MRKLTALLAAVAIAFGVASAPPAAAYPSPDNTGYDLLIDNNIGYTGIWVKIGYWGGQYLVSPGQWSFNASPIDWESEGVTQLYLGAYQCVKWWRLSNGQWTGGKVTFNASNIGRWTSTATGIFGAIPGDFLVKSRNDGGSCAALTL